MYAAIDWIRAHFAAVAREAAASAMAWVILTVLAVVFVCGCGVAVVILAALGLAWGTS